MYNITTKTIDNNKLYWIKRTTRCGRGSTFSPWCCAGPTSWWAPTWPSSGWQIATTWRHTCGMTSPGETVPRARWAIYCAALSGTDDYVSVHGEVLTAGILELGRNHSGQGFPVGSVWSTGFEIYLSGSPISDALHVKLQYKIMSL